MMLKTYNEVYAVFSLFLLAYMKTIKCRYFEAVTLLSSQQNQCLKVVGYNAVQVKNQKLYSLNLQTDFSLSLIMGYLHYLEDEIANTPQTCTLGKCFTLFCHTGSAMHIKFSYIF